MYWLVFLVIFIVGVVFGLVYFISIKKKKFYKGNIILINFIVCWNKNKIK